MHSAVSVTALPVQSRYWCCGAPLTQAFFSDTWATYAGV